MAQTLGIFTGSSSKDEKSEASNDNHISLTEEDESDDDFDHEEVELLDDESFAEDCNMERQLLLLLLSFITSTKSLSVEDFY